MSVHTAEVEWQGKVREGKGNLKLGSGVYNGPFSFRARVEGGQGSTTPEELIGAAHAACFSMTFANIISQAGFTPVHIHTTAHVNLNVDPRNYGIDQIEL